MNPHSPHRYDNLNQLSPWLTAIVVTVAFSLGPGAFGPVMRQGVDPVT